MNQPNPPSRSGNNAALTFLPLLLVVVLIYNLLSFAGPGFDNANSEAMTQFLSHALFNIPMISGGVWVFTIGDFVLLLGLVLLFVEIVKSTRTEAKSVINHGLSLLVFVGCLIEFLTLANFATSVFFLLMVMTALDVVAGFTISIVAAKRDLGVSGGIIGTN